MKNKEVKDYYRQKICRNERIKESMDIDGWLKLLSLHKRMFGEHTVTTKFQNMVKEMIIEVSS
jgi:hypothetical protein